MLVYRVASKEEIDFILNFKDFSKIGNFSDEYAEQCLNSHKYILGTRYMHFFKDEDSFLYLDYFKKYLCTYDIDDDLLNSYKGIGFYLDIFFFRNKVEVLEYAIPSSLISFDNLVSVNLIAKDIDSSDLELDSKDAFVLKYKR